MFQIQIYLFLEKGELTTMSGRRLRWVHNFFGPWSCLCSICLSLSLLHDFSNAIRAKLISSGVVGDDAYVVVAGPANTYAHYVTTPEEYGQQRYEGASTVFGQCKYSVMMDIQIEFVYCAKPSTGRRYFGRLHWQIRRSGSLPRRRCSWYAIFGCASGRTNFKGDIFTGNTSASSSS